jgi:flagellar hook-associated protein 2
MASSFSFQGVTSGLQTDALVNAIIQQEGQPLQRLKDKQALNDKRTAALTAMKTAMSALNTSLATLQDTGFDSRTVTNSDANATYASATASGAAVGNYDLTVTQVATRATLSSTLVGGVATNLALANGNAAPVFSTGTGASFALQGPDGAIKVVNLTSANNTLNGLRDAINASGGGVTATIVNSGKGDKPYQLVLAAKDTGTGTGGGRVTIADVTANDGVTAPNNLGISAAQVDSLMLPTAFTLAGGLQSAVAAQDALFTVNGIALTRKTNLVTDAVDGITFTLKKGAADPANPAPTATTLTVSQSKTAATSAMQDVVSKYNAFMKIYKDASVSTKNDDGSVNPGALAQDQTARTLVSQVRTALMGTPTGLSAGAAFKNPAELGLKTNADGTLSLDTKVFSDALDKDPGAAKQVGQGMGHAVQDLYSNVSTYSTGILNRTLKNITDQNLALTRQIDAGQVRLDKRQATLKAQFAKMETTLSQMQSAGSSLSSMV